MQIQNENLAMFRRLQKTESVYSIGKWKKSRAKNEKISQNISRNAARISNKYPTLQNSTMAGPIIRDILRERASRPGTTTLNKPVLGYEKSESRPVTSINKLSMS